MNRSPVSNSQGHAIDGSGRDAQSATILTPTEQISARLRRVTPLVAILTVIVGIAALKLAATVLLPLVFALFLVAIFWPLQRRLQARLPRGLASGLTFLVFLLVVGCFVAGFWLCGQLLAQKWPEIAPALEQYRGLAESYGIPLPGSTGGESQTSGSGGQSSLMRFARSALSAGGAAMLVIAYLLLGLLEMQDYRLKLRHILPAGEDEHWREVSHEVTNDFQRYMIVRTGIGLINGVLIWLAAWLLGLEFAFIWGFLSFLLNYIPTIGSVVAVIFPVLFALAQAGGGGLPWLTLLVFGGIQILLGVVLDPLIEGHYLAPSPLVVLLSVTFWGWVWGIAGAFIGVPLTILVIITCKQFARTRWIATLLSDVDGPQEQPGS
jgi:AI-2 transport protein TqsA